MTVSEYDREASIMRRSWTTNGCCAMGKKSINLLKRTGYVLHLQFKHSRILHSAHTVFMCFTFISEQMANFAPYDIN